MKPLVFTRRSPASPTIHPIVKAGISMRMKGHRNLDLEKYDELSSLAHFPNPETNLLSFYPVQIAESEVSRVGCDRNKLTTMKTTGSTTIKRSVGSILTMLHVRQ